MKKIALPFFLLMLMLASLACTIFVGGPDYPSQAIPVSNDAAQSIQDAVKQAVAAGASTGVITLQINETQLTSYLAYKLDAQVNPLMTDPQVYLRDGQMQLFGKVQRGWFTANVSIITSVSVDENGKPKIDVISTDFGPLPAPAGLNDAISTIVSEAYTGSLGPVATGFRLDSINIANGVMTLTGRVK